MRSDAMLELQQCEAELRKALSSAQAKVAPDSVS